MAKDYDYLVVGTGLFAAVFVRQAIDAGKKCLVIDKRGHAGGNIYCSDCDGIPIHRYGAHIFHTSDKTVWDFVNKYVSFNRYINSPLANSQGILYNLPFNMNTFSKLWGVNTPLEAKAKIEEQCLKYSHFNNPENLEQQALRLCGEDIYYKLIKDYTEKQWGRLATELPAFIIKRLPFRFLYDNNYFDDEYQGIPVEGYNFLIKKLLEGAKIWLNIDFFQDRYSLEQMASKTVFTGCIDEFFDYKFGRLEYRSLKFEDEYLLTDNFQGNAVVNYCDKDVPYTRIIEHKHFVFGDQKNTVITREYPLEVDAKNEPYYPINDHKNMTIYQKYFELKNLEKKAILGGRLAQYAYFDMDDTIAAALDCSQMELSLNNGRF